MCRNTKDEIQYYASHKSENLTKSIGSPVYQVWFHVFRKARSKRDWEFKEADKHSMNYYM